MVRELTRIFIIVLLSMLMHLAILQLSFETRLSVSANHSNTEVGLVERSRWQEERADSPSAEIGAEKKVPVTGSGVSDVPPDVKVPLKLMVADGMESTAAGSELYHQQEGEMASARDVRKEVKKFASESIANSPSDFGSPVKKQSVAGTQNLKPVSTETEALAVEMATRMEPEREVVEQSVELPAATETAQAESISKPAPSPQKVASLENAAVLFSSMQAQTGLVEMEARSAVPRYDLNPAPVYPDIALRKGWEGLVLLKVAVRSNGSVASVDIEESSGFKALDRSALKAVRRWQFVPALSAGVPVAGGALIPINFDLP